MLMLQASMAAIVLTYYFWPAGAAVLSSYAAWQHQGGILAAALVTALAAGGLSECSLVYFQNKGRWTLHHVEHMAFKFGMFFIGGAIVYIFYGYQAIWFGNGNSWPVLLKKVFVDQFIFSFFWANPYSATLVRWHALHYSFPKLWREFDLNFATERILPICITGWMFWIPGVFLIYSMPTPLQVPLFIFANAMWGILMPAVAKQEKEVLAAEEEVTLA
jgi:hypothetical protein